MRGEKGNPQDPGIAAYVDHINHGLAQLPDHHNKPNEFLSRGMDKQYIAQQWSDARVSGEWHDYTVQSTTTGSFVPGDAKLRILGETPGMKDIGAYSFWPGEGEVLAPPGTTFTIITVASQGNVAYVHVKGTPQPALPPGIYDGKPPGEEWRPKPPVTPL